MRPETAITAITAPPMPSAVEVFLETPKKGQMPSILVNTKLLTRIQPITKLMQEAIGVRKTGDKQRQRMNADGIIRGQFL